MSGLSSPSFLLHTLVLRLRELTVLLGIQACDSIKAPPVWVLGDEVWGKERAPYTAASVAQSFASYGAFHLHLGILDWRQVFG